jgi:site-specific DNA recombinase
MSPIRKIPSVDLTKRVGIWIRVSTEDQARGESPEHHERRARMYAESKGWEVVRVYDLSGVSGRSVSDHPEARAMLADVAEHHITGLIFSKLARLARNTRELLDFSAYFEQHSADLVSLAESIDTSTPAGRFFYTLIAAMAQWEREEIADRVQASVAVRAKMGKPLGGAAPFGYAWVDRKLVPDPNEAPVRRRMHELFLRERRVRTVARLLNDAGHRTRNGSLFSGTTVRRLLEDPIAKGERRTNYTRSTGDGKHWELKSPDEWNTLQVEPIVSQEVWDECFGVLLNRKKGERPAKRPVHLFAGKVVCECGGVMTVPSNSPKYVCRTCRRKITPNDLETVFQEQLKGFFLSPQDIEDYLDRADGVLAEKRALLTTLRAEEVKLRAEMEKVYQLYLAGELSPRGFGDRNRRLEQRAVQLLEEIPRIEGEADHLAVELVSKEEFASRGATFYGRWDTLNPQEKRAIVESVLDRITVGESTIVIDISGASAPHGNRDTLATQPQGFMAATNRNRAG